jgi:hypothetical protein
MKKPKAVSWKHRGERVSFFCYECVSDRYVWANLGTYSHWDDAFGYLTPKKLEQIGKFFLAAAKWKKGRKK